MTARLVPAQAHPGHVRAICCQLREWDRREIFALMYGDDPEDLARVTLAAGPFSWVALRDDQPVAAIGATPAWPGVWRVWAFGTDDFPRVAFLLTRHVLTVMIPSLRACGAHRADCLSVVGHTVAQRWLLSLGAFPEAVLKGYGRNGEDFIMFAWRADPCAVVVVAEAATAPQ